tara:strand:- start:1592 stop:1999 length:408 start_codon:yes stop_codon:yes gene_type:complete
MVKVFSKVNPTKLLLSELKYSAISEYRTDLSPDEEFLQVSGRRFKSKIFIPAHKHNFIERKTDITQEAWCIIEGKIKGTFYDLDNTIIYETILTKGDCIVLYRGGHSLEVLEENTVFYEFKTGPYFGVDMDKEKI